jgi:hypothetical protein
MKSVSFTRYALSAGVAAALLAACGGSQRGVYPGPVGQQNVRPRVVAERGSCPTSDCIIVGNGEAGKYLGSLLFFRRNANGNVRPAGRTEGSLTQLDYPTGIAMDSEGDIYAANLEGDSITVYAAGSEGNVAPVRTIAGSQTKLRGPTGVALDSSSNIYVTNSDSILVYGANAKGNATPKRLISGSLTKLGEPAGIAIDASGYAYVANWDASTLLVFAPGANGNEPPAREDSSGLYGPDGVALDARAREHVSNGSQDNPPFVAVYAAGAVNAEPLRTIEGRKTRLNRSTSIVVR